MLVKSSLNMIADKHILTMFHCQKHEMNGKSVSDRK